MLFPWFFVIPGLLAAAFGVVARRSPSLVWRRVLVALGVGLIAAPAVFQMFTRAPGGAAMIDDFRPLMTEHKVTTVQGYFLTLGAAEGQLRTEVLAKAAPGDLPATRRWSADWPRISNEMAPMIGTMADNVGNFRAVDALPPFWLFPWFFALPGLAVFALALAAQRLAPATVAFPADARIDTAPERTIA